MARFMSHFNFYNTVIYWIQVLETESNFQKGSRVELNLQNIYMYDLNYNVKKLWR